MPSEDNNVLPKNCIDLNNQTVPCEQFEDEEIRPSQSLLESTNRLINATEPTKFCDNTKTNKVARNNSGNRICSCDNPSNFNPKNDKLETITADDYEYYIALEFYNNNLRRKIFSEQDILKIKRITGGSESIDFSIDDYNKVKAWQSKNKLKSADGCFGEDSVKKYNRSVNNETDKLKISFRSTWGDSEKIGENKDIIANLMEDDINPTPLNADKSNECTYSDDVNEFLQNYSRQQSIPYSFVVQLVSHRNFALITLLIAVANYGVTDIPDKLKDKDPLVIGGELNREDGFERFNTGKNAYAYQPVGDKYSINGGLGIAHFDAAHYINFYQVFGFPEECEPEELLYKEKNKVIVPVEKDDVALTASKNENTNHLRVTNTKLTIRNTSVKAKTYDGHESESYEGVKRNSKWLSWASKVVSSRIRQQYLFCYWKDHFWNPCMKKYEKANNDNATLQNVIRCARAKNSGKGSDTSLKTSQLVNTYISEIKSKKHRRVVQSVNVKRAIVLIDYILDNEDKGCNANGDSKNIKSEVGDE